MKIIPRTSFKPAPKPKYAHPKSSPLPGYKRRAFSLTYNDLEIIQRCADEKGLGRDGVSAALRYIIRDWEQLQERKQYPLLIAVPAYMLRQDDSE